MVGSRKLSNDEVEALLSGLDEESKDQTAQQFDPNEVREFKFGTEDLSLLGDYYALRMINEKICRFTRSVFLPMLRIMPRISSFPPEVKSFDEYVESCDNFVSVTNNRIEELRYGNQKRHIENRNGFSHDAADTLSAYCRPELRVVLTKGNNRASKRYACGRNTEDLSLIHI